MAPLILIDVGNTRIKVARADGPDGLLEPIDAIDVDRADDIRRLVECTLRAEPNASWRMADVHPSVAGPIRRQLGEAGARLFSASCAADVPVPHRLETPQTTGADRALNVLAAAGLMREAGRHGPGIVISCGTALVVERIDAGGVWDGGAIAPGLRLAAQALHGGTARLPLIAPGGEATPGGHGRSTATAIASGVFWGVVGSARELIGRQSEGLTPLPWRIWTGGDAGRVSDAVEGESARVVPDLVLQGLLRLHDGRGPDA